MALRRLAGSNIAGFSEGVGNSVSFRDPAGVAVDCDGNILVADYENHRIRRISPSGVTITLAGSGLKDWVDGEGSSASFQLPLHVAVDAEGVTYVADYGNERVRKVTPQGMVSTLAGSGERGGVDGKGLEASFADPTGVAVDFLGNVFVSEPHRIRKITPDGIVTTLAGGATPGFNDGIGASAMFNRPQGLAIDVDGHVLVADCDNFRIRRVTADGVVTTVAGTGAEGEMDGPGHIATFSRPCDLAADVAGNIVVADLPSRVRLITHGVVSTLVQDLEGLNAVALDCEGRVVVAEGDGEAEGEGHHVSVIEAHLGPPPHLQASPRLKASLPSALSDFRRLLTDCTLADVTFIVGEERISAHRAILAARSTYFLTMFRSEFQESALGSEVSVYDASPAAFRALLSYLYSDELDVEDECLMEVLVLAHRYDIDGLQNRCSRQVSRVLSAKNAISFLVAAHKSGLEKVCSNMLAFVRQNFWLIKAEALDSLQLLEEHPRLAVELLARLA